MGTRANIKINNIETPFVLSVSHDGYPDQMLTILADFYYGPEAMHCFDGLRDRYLQDYTDTSNVFVSSDLIQPDFEYAVSRNGTLTIREYGVGLPLDPLSTVERFEVDCQDAVRERIRTAVSVLADLGIFIQVGRDDVDYAEIADAGGLVAFL
jgi:hypothetical protein